MSGGSRSGASAERTKRKARPHRPVAPQQRGSGRRQIFGLPLAAAS
jgi:hypothetical protein